MAERTCNCPNCLSGHHPYCWQQSKEVGRLERYGDPHAEFLAEAKIERVAVAIARADEQSGYDYDYLRIDHPEVSDWSIHLALAAIRAASGIEAGTDETPKAAQPEGREPGPQGDAQPALPSSDKERE